MENGVSENHPYTFFEEESVEKYFADLHLKLLSGRHIQQQDANAFALLEDYYPQLKHFYARIYSRDLVQDIADTSVYFYLDFFESSREKLIDPSRYKPLTEFQTILGLMLLDMYYSRYFQHPKNISWTDIRKEIEEGDRKQEYQQLLFKERRSDYTEREWNFAIKRFTAVIQLFDDLGWVKKLSGQQEELLFTIQPSIHRMAKLYSKELEDFGTFAERYKNQTQE
jgi:chromosome condensin MukBEF MukE localization factor